MPLVPETLPVWWNRHSPRAPARSQHHVTISFSVLFADSTTNAV